MKRIIKVEIFPEWASPAFSARQIVVMVTYWSDGSSRREEIA